MTTSSAAVRFLSLNVEGGGLYKKPTGDLPLANMGVVLLQGPEGSGKSTIPEALCNIVEGKGAPRGGLGAVSKRSLPAGYLSTARLMSLGREMRLTQAHKHPVHGSKYEIAIQGVDPATMPQKELDQRKMIRRLVPLSYDEYLGTTYFYQGGVHGLLSGTSAANAAFLTTVFGLDFWGDLITALKEEIKGLERDARSTGDVEQALIDARDLLTQEEAALKALPAGDAIDAALVLRNQEMQALSVRLGRAQAAQKAREALARAQTAMAKALEGYESLRGAQEAREALIGQRGAYEAEVAKHRAALKAAKKTQADYDETVAALASAVKRSKRALAEATKSASEKTDEVKKKKAAVLDVPSHEEAISFFQGLLSKGVTPVQGKSPKHKIDFYVRAVMNKEVEISALRSKKKALGGKAVCPTCEQPVLNHVLSWEGQIEALEAERDKNSIRACHAAYVQSYAVFPPYPEGYTVEKALKALRASQVARAEIPRLERAIAEEDRRARGAADALKTDEKALADKQAAPPPEVTDISAALQKVERRLEKTTAAIQDVDHVFTLAAKCQAAQEAVPAATDVEDVETLNAEMQEIRSKVEALTSERAGISKAQHRVDMAVARVEERQRAVDAYAAKALRLKAAKEETLPYLLTQRASRVRSGLSQMETVLPVYLGTIADKQYAGAEMKISVNDDLSDVDIRMKTSKFAAGPIDAVLGSFGQRQRFSLALFAATHEIAPRKSNVVFLDEPFTSLEADGKRAVLHRLIPAMRERVQTLESVFVVSHDAEVLQSSDDTFDHVWEVSLTRGEATISTHGRLSRLGAK